MRIMKNVLAAASALAMTALPVAAQAAQASAPTADRAVATNGDEAQLRGRGGFFLLPLALVAVIVAIIIAVDSNNNSPTSP